MDGERQQHHEHVGAELAQDVVAEPRGEREEQRGHAEGRELDDEREQPHRDVVEPFGRLLEAARGLGARQREAHAEQQREHHDREHVALGHRLHDVVGHQPDEEVDTARTRGGRGRRRHAGLGFETLPQRRREPGAGADQVHERDADQYRDRRHRDGVGEGA